MTSRSIPFAPLLTALVFTAGCYISDNQAPTGPEPGSPCTKEGATLTTLECAGGSWRPLTSQPDMPEDITEDMPDETPTEDMKPPNNSSPCVPETNAVFCSRSSAECGMFTGTDNCGDERTLDCGTCRGGECLPNNTCTECVPETDAEFCMKQQALCGPVGGFDRCGNEINVESCGECDAPDICDGVNRICRCPRISDQLLCENNGAECGVLTATDVCGEVRTVSCGTCSPGECNPDNTCSMCQAETDEELCDAAATECGDLSVMDSCGEMRMLDCGECAPGENCDTGQCVCPIPKCAVNNCGLVFSACGESIDCGSCPMGQQCENTFCVSCVPEDDATFCQRYSAECGTKSGQDNCSANRTVDCGVCRTGDCNNNQCNNP